MALLPDLLEFHNKQLGLYRRNRKLVLALLLTTCLGGIVLPFIQTATCEVANLAFAQAKTSPAVTRNLGFPLRRGPLAVGNLESRGSEGEASLSFSIYGPFGRGVLYADAVRFNQKWQLISLDLEFPGHFGRMNLMPIQSTIPR